MSEPKWAPQADVEEIHDIIMEIGGGSRGLRDPVLLKSALGRPQNQYAYGERDMFRLAAGYAEAISRNHPFVDGNKRTAFQTADVFLADNGHELDCSKGRRHAEMMERLGRGHISRFEMAEYLAEHSRDVEG